MSNPSSRRRVLDQRTLAQPFARTAEVARLARGLPRRCLIPGREQQHSPGHPGLKRAPETGTLPHEPQERRLRQAAELVARVTAAVGDPASTRAALLTRTIHGDAFEALSRNDPDSASAAIGEVLKRGVTPPRQYADERIDRALVELEHLRDDMARGDV